MVFRPQINKFFSLSINTKINTDYELFYFLKFLLNINLSFGNLSAFEASAIKLADSDPLC